MHEAPPVWQWLLPRTGVLRTLVAAVRGASSDRRGSRALNSRTEDTGSTPCPDRPPRTTPPTAPPSAPRPRAGAFRRPPGRPNRRPGRREAPSRPPRPRTAWATSSAGRRSAVFWCRSSSWGTAFRPRAPAGPRWVSRRSRPRADCCCVSQNVAQHSCTVNSIAAIVGVTGEAARGRTAGGAGRTVVRRWSEPAPPATPYIFSQLRHGAHPLSGASPNPRSTRAERTPEGACALRGPATDLRRTSQQRS